MGLAVPGRQSQEIHRSVADYLRQQDQGADADHVGHRRRARSDHAVPRDVSRALRQRRAGAIHRISRERPQPRRSRPSGRDLEALHRLVQEVSEVMRYVIILAFIASTALARGITKESIASGGQQRTYYLFVPEHPKGPLIVALHGSGHNGSLILEHWQGLTEKEGIVLECCDAINPQWWTYRADGPDFIRGVIEGVEEKVAIDPRRDYQFGHSEGEKCALKISKIESKHFAAAAI